MVLEVQNQVPARFIKVIEGWSLVGRAIIGVGLVLRGVNSEKCVSQEFVVEGGGREFKRSVATVEGVEDSLANILAILSSKKFTVVGFVLPHF